MPFGGSQVDQAAFSEQVDAASVLHCVLVDKGARGALGGRQLFERRDVDFDVEMARVRDDGAVLHECEVLLAEDVLVAGDGAEDVADFGGSSMLITRNPSMTASRAFVGSISVMITSAPAPRARDARPRPHQP